MGNNPLNLQLSHYFFVIIVVLRNSKNLMKNSIEEFVLIVNGSKQVIKVDPKTPLLWVLRDYLELTGTKYGCGIAQCGACTVHLNGSAVRSCVTPVSSLENIEITTIEGLSKEGELHVVQQSWIEEDVPQCGYCQSGQIMSASALLDKYPKPSDDDINNSMRGNICRCGTYPRIIKAIKRASNMLE